MTPLGACRLSPAAIIARADQVALGHAARGVAAGLAGTAQRVRSGKIETTFATDVTIPDGPAGRRRRLVVLLICSSSLFITYLDSTILTVALPTLQKELHASIAGLQWVSDAYLLVVASLLMLTGSTADRLGRKRLFLIGLAGFSLGSLLCSLAPNTGSLIALRMVQGLGGSMLTPISLSIVRNTFHDQKERAQALGIWSGIFGVAAACGPVVGGLLVSSVGWRSIFWVNVPIGVAMIAATVRYLPESRAPRPRRVDVPGQLLMIVFLGSLTYAVIQGPVSGWTAVPIVALFVVAAVSLAAFVVVERRQPEPLLEPRFFRSRPFTGASLIAVLAFVVLGVAVMGDLVTSGVSSGVARGETHAVALSAATHAAWAVALACGVVIALTGYLTTSARARASAAAVVSTK